MATLKIIKPHANLDRNSKQNVSLKITYSQGCLMICGSKIDDIAQQSIKNTQIPIHFLRNRQKRDGPHYHITLLTRDEMETVMLNLSLPSKDKQIDYIISKANKDLKLTRTQSIVHLLNIGIGKLNAHKSTCYYSIIIWPETLRFRRNLKLLNNDFDAHITLGFHPNDIHKTNKSIATIQTKQTDINHNTLFEIIQRFSTKKDTQIIIETLQILISSIVNDKELLCRVLSYRAFVFGQKSRFNDCLNDTEEILNMDPYYVPAIISKAIALLSMKRPLEAAEIFRLSQQTLHLYINAKGDRNQQLAKHRLSLFFGEDMNVWMERIKKGLNQCRKDALSVALSTRIRISIKYTKHIHLTKGQIPEHVSWHSTVLPRNFSWVVDGWLCGTSLPKSAEQLKAFEAMNIGLIVTIFDKPLSNDILKTMNRDNIKYIHLKTANYKAPRLFDLERYIAEAEQCIFVRHKAVLVHCGGGKGRAGTGLACFIIKWGLIFDEEIDINGVIPRWRQPQKSGSEAIQHIQRVRPGSIETKEQEQFIKQYANHLWSKVNNDDESKENKQDIDCDPTGLKRYPLLSDEQLKCIKNKVYPELVILCGIPGSGKTLFCRLIHTLNKQQRDNESKSKIVNEWRFANQDKMGKKGNVELFVKKWLSAKVGSRIGLIIDRCNVTKKERKYWMEITFNIKKTVAIYFDVDPKICKHRIYERKNHPTINNRSESNIDRLIRDFSKNMQIPTEKEGFNKVFTIKNTNDLLGICCTVFGCLTELIQHFIPTKFFKFPRTPHLWNTGAATRDDIRLDLKYCKLYYGNNAKTLIVTEKVDGANLGISINANYEIECQHRGSAIVYNSSKEYSKLKDWLNRKSKFLSQILQKQRYIMFGEWCQCKHSILYDALPDYFLVFDLYDRYDQCFVSRAKLQRICEGKFVLTKVICRRKFKTKDEIEQLMNNTMSTYKIKKPGPIEGLYLKIDDDDKEINVHRCKLVRSEFIQGITKHWIHNKLEYNTVRQIFDDEEDELGVNKEKKNDDEGKEDKLYHSVMAKSGLAMNIGVICNKLKLNESELLSVFVIGSRVWGTATSKSDWDIMIVTRNKNKKVFVSVDNIDAYILDKEQWIEELNNHRFVCWITLFLPIEAIWKCDLTISECFSYKMFVDTLLKEIDKDCRKLNKFYTKNKMDKVYKTFIHTLRMCEISKQMIVLLKDKYGMEIKCEDLACNSFVGIIEFNEIENIVREKQMKLQMDSYSDDDTKQTSSIWINELKNCGKECLNLIS